MNNARHTIEVNAAMHPAKVLCINVGFCTIVAFFWQTIKGEFTAEGLLTGLIYSQCIGNSICILFLLHDRFINTERSKKSPLVWLEFPVMVLVGFLLGNTLAQVIQGHDVTFFDLNSYVFRSLLLSIIISVICVWYFSTRERVVRMELRASQQAERTSNAQLSMIRAQVEPHMLFNTLANLRVLIDQNPEQAQSMLDQLIEFLRATLNGSRTSECKLSEEFDVIENYLALMKVRMAARLTYSLSLPSSLRNCRVPSLIVQPLIENAIKHGLEPNSDGGSISVAAVEVDNQLLITVKDDGIGMGSHSATAGFGLESIRERLRAFGELSGQDALVVINSPPMGKTSGTEVELFLPLLFDYVSEQTELVRATNEL